PAFAVTGRRTRSSSSALAVRPNVSNESEADLPRLSWVGAPKSGHSEGHLRVSSRPLGMHRFAAVAPPSRHKPATLVEHVAAPVSAFHITSYQMSQAHLRDLAWDRSRLAHPIAERRPEAMNREMGKVHPV